MGSTETVAEWCRADSDMGISLALCVVVAACGYRISVVSFLALVVIVV